MGIDKLNENISRYIVKNQAALDGKAKKEFVETVSRKLNIIRQPVKRTERYVADYNIAIKAGRPTTAITNRWIRDVGIYADEMCRFDIQAKSSLFQMDDDFRTNIKTQELYKNNVLNLSELYNIRLHEITKDMPSIVKNRYLESIQSDRDFILSYFEQEKYQEKERSYDDGDAPTEELAPKKERTVTKQNVQKESDDDFRYGSYEEISKKIDEMREKEKAENMLQGAVQKGRVDGLQLDDR